MWAKTMESCIIIPIGQRDVQNIKGRKTLRDGGGLAADGFKTTASITMRKLKLFVCQLSGKGLALVRHCFVSFV